MHNDKRDAPYISVSVSCVRKCEGDRKFRRVNRDARGGKRITGSDTSRYQIAPSWGSKLPMTNARAIKIRFYPRDHVPRVRARDACFVFPPLSDACCINAGRSLVNSARPPRNAGLTGLPKLRGCDHPRDARNARAGARGNELAPFHPALRTLACAKFTLSMARKWYYVIRVRQPPIR